jgi:hypothetical protein
LIKIRIEPTTTAYLRLRRTTEREKASVNQSRIRDTSSVTGELISRRKGNGSGDSGKGVLALAVGHGSGAVYPKIVVTWAKKGKVKATTRPLA